MKNNTLRQRTKSMALRVIKIVQALPKTSTGEVIGKQVLRSGTSVAANYYGACKARSRKDFISKIEISEEEADETLLWLELIVDAELMEETRVRELIGEVNEIISILAASQITAKKHEAGSSIIVTRQS
jgi:four helix bundle protein